MEREILKMTEREIIEITEREDIEAIIYGEDDEFIYIDEEQTYLSLENGYEKITVIVKRISDNKFFKIEYTHSCDCDEYGNQLIEVFPEKFTTTLYK